MTDPPIQPGAPKTYVSGVPAIAYLDVDMHVGRFLPPADDVEIPPMNINLSGFDSEDYMVVGGQPCGRPRCQVRLRSRVGIGSWNYSEAPPAPADVDNKATMRWLPNDQTFAPDGTYWTPTVGAGLALVATNGPYLDDNYSFEVRGGDEVSLPAVIFSRDAGMRLSSAGWAAPAFTFILVAVTHPNPEGPVYGLIESSTTDDPGNPNAPTDWGLRYNQGRVNLFAGNHLTSHVMSAMLGRPVFFAISVDTASGRLLVCDRNKTSSEFSTQGFSLYDIDVLLGQTGTGNPGETAYMDVLDFSYFDRALSFADLNEQLHLMDSIYGIVN